MRWRNALVLGVGATLMTGGVARAASNELSVSSQLQDRREVTSGTRAYAVGFEDGRFYANGWHITGEMGGVWTPPMKMLDGLWFGVDGQWVGQATKFTSGHGYVRYDLPSVDGLGLARTDFAPDGKRAVLFGLTISNPGGSAKTVPVKVDAHSELMGSWPWGTDPNRGTPDASNNLPDAGSYANGALQFTDDGSLGAGAPVHHYAALVASNLRPDSGEAAASGGSYHGPQPGTKCAATTARRCRRPCDDGPFGNGTGGELRYSVRVPAGGSTTVWVAAAGSDQGLSAAQSELAGALQNPAAAFAAKQASRAADDSRTQVTLPGDPLLQQAVDWSKQNLADETQTVQNLQIRWTDQGKNQFAPVLGTVKSATFYSAGFPDYPWLFGTDGEYTAFAGLALGQFETVEDHLRALRDVSDVLNNKSGVVVHEAVQDGSVYFGHDSQRTATDGTKTNDFNTDETVKFPSIVAHRVALDGRRPLPRRDVRLRQAQPALRRATTSTPTTTAGPRARATSSAPAWARRSSTTPSTTSARSTTSPTWRGPSTTAGRCAWTTRTARDLESRFESTWWNAAVRPVRRLARQRQRADLPEALDRRRCRWRPSCPTAPRCRRPRTGRRRWPGVRRRLPRLRGRCNQGLFHTGVRRRRRRQGRAADLLADDAIQAVGEGNYGRMGAGQQQRYTDADAETMISEPATGGTPDEQPGAMPEILPSPDFAPTRTSIAAGPAARWSCRPGATTARRGRSIHQQLGVAPRLDEGALRRRPAGAGRAAVGQGRRHPRRHGLRVRLRRPRGQAVHDPRALSHVRASLTVGAILPASARVAAVYVDGRKARHYDAATTNRGLQITATGSSLTVQTR